MVGQHQRVARRTSTERPGVAPCAGTAPPPNILVVGDYLFDSTLNGVMDSADCVTDMLLSRNLTQRRPRALGIRCDYFDLYEGSNMRMRRWAPTSDLPTITSQPQGAEALKETLVRCSPRRRRIKPAVRHLPDNQLSDTTISVLDRIPPVIDPLC